MIMLSQAVKKRENSPKFLSDRGFTIVELLIATAVLSTILVLVSVVMVNIGKLYYKGINQARVQDDARSITDELAQHLSLGDSYNHIVGAGGQQAYCIGTTRYTYVLYRQVGNDPTKQQSPHVLWRDQLNSLGDCASLPNLGAATPSANGTEMIAPNSRLTGFNIAGVSPYNLSVGVAYGDNDLLCDIGVSNNCKLGNISTLINDPAYAPGNNGKNIRCKGDIGDQFCATSFLQTTVTRRLP
jgi:prepilin-type N-terminal cleavage/methylation domain-containing protein